MGKYIQPIRSALALTFVLSSFQTAGCEKYSPASPLPLDTPPIVPLVSVTPLLSATSTPSPPATVRASETPIIPEPSFTPSQTPSACLETAGTIVQDSFLSYIIGREFHYRIYLPPCYTLSGKRYPTLILLHGYGYALPGDYWINDEQWDRIGVDEVATEEYLAGRLAPMIIVMPNGLDANYNDDSPDALFPQVVARELIPWIDTHFCTWKDSSKRAIGGISRGGYWAYYIAFRFPQMFSKVGGHSPFFYPPSSESASNPQNLIHSDGIEYLTLYIDHGTADYSLLILRTEQFISLLEQRGIPVRYVIYEGGGHTEEYWGAHLADYLAFYSDGWPLSLSQYPPCAEP